MSRSTTSYDLVIIGGGPGGYPCAIRASQLGLSVAVIDDRELLGGTCLNIGCIPSKALLQATERLEMARNLEAFGVMVDNVRADLDGVMRHKGKVVTELGEGVAYLLRKHKVARFQGRGRLLARDRVEVRAADGAFEVQASKAVVIASGSEAGDLARPAHRRAANRHLRRGALSLTAAPRHLAVIGGGYVGLELGSVWRRLGSEVTVIEVLDRIASGVDSEMSAALHKVLEAQGFQFCLGHKVVGSRMEGDDVVLDVEPMGDGARGTIKADVVLVSIGRRPATARLDLETVGIAPDRRGFIPVDEGFRTSADGVYADRRRSSAAPCWPTRRRRKGSPWPNAWRGARAMWTTERFRRSSIPGRNWPQSGAPRTTSRRPAWPIASGAFRSRQTPWPRRGWRRTGWSRCWRTPGRTRFSACTSWGRTPAV